MDGLFIGRLFTASAVGILLTALAGCTDEKYDLGKLDTNVTVLQNVSIPLGSMSEAIGLGDIIGLEDASGFISADESGDLSFSWYPEEIYSVNFTVPDLEFDHESFKDIRIPLGNFDVSSDESAGLQQIRIPLQGISFPVKFVCEDVPSEIKDIKRMNFGGLIFLDIGFAPISESPVSHLILGKGASIQFPEWMQVEENIRLFSRSDDGSRFTLKEDLKIPVENDWTSTYAVWKLVAVDFDRMPEGQGFLNGKIDIDAEIPFEGELVVPADAIVSSGPFSPVFRTALDFGERSISTMLTDLALDLNGNIAETTLEGLPEFLTGGDAVLDFTDAHIDMSFHNKTPLSGNFCVDIKTYTGTEEIASVALVTPEFNASDRIGETFRWSFSESEVSVPEGYEYIAAPGLNRLVSQMPDRISFDGFHFTRSSDYIEVSPGKDYEGRLSYGLCAPLTFGENLKLSFTVDMDRLGFVLQGMTMTKAELAMDMINTIPWDFSLEVLVLDKSGEPVPGIRISQEDSVVKAGTLSSPQTTPLCLVLDNDDEVLSFDGIRLVLKVSGSSTYAGTALNKNQGLEVKNLVLTLPEGISADLDL